jgi:imidazolonepropionase-like amidohydrolase
MPQRIVISGSQLITLDSLGTISHGYIALRDNRIEAVGPQAELRIGPEDTVFEVPGTTVLPGLIDSHCHLISENAYPITEPYVVRSTVAGVRAARMALQSGITSVRDVGCRHAGIFALKAAVEAGDIAGPRFQTAGRPISGTGIMETWRSHSHDGPIDVLRGVRTEWQAGATWIKLSISDGRWRGSEGWHDTPLMTPPEIQSAVEEAHRKDMRVVCHVDGPMGAELAVQGGVDSIEHGVSIPLPILEQMAMQGTFLVPTVWIYSTQDLGVVQADISMLNDLHAETIRRARDIGVRIAAGIDYDYAKCLPLDGLVNELSALVERGLTRKEAIESATLRGAELLGWENSLGSLAEGKLADVVMIEGDPLSDIEDLRRILLVIQDGRIAANKLESTLQIDSHPLPALEPSWMA